MRDKTCSRNAQRKKPTGQVWWRIPHIRSFRLTWLTPKLVVPSSTTSPCMFTLTRLEAVISLYIIPGGPAVSNGVFNFYEMKIKVFWSINLFYQTGWEESAQCLGWPLLSRGCICPASNSCICTANNIWHPTIRKDNAMKTQQTMCVPNLTPAVDVNESVDCRKFTP